VSQLSFSSDLAVFKELDEIAGTCDAAAYDRRTILAFLRAKGWVLEELKDVEDVDSRKVSNCQYIYFCDAYF